MLYIIIVIIEQHLLRVLFHGPSVRGIYERAQVNSGTISLKYFKILAHVSCRNIFPQKMKLKCIVL